MKSDKNCKKKNKCRRNDFGEKKTVNEKVLRIVAAAVIVVILRNLLKFSALLLFE